MVQKKFIKLIIILINIYDLFSRIKENTNPLNKPRLKNKQLPRKAILKVDKL